jgi:hypothetical protein
MTAACPVGAVVQQADVAAVDLVTLPSLKAFNTILI